MQDSQLRYDAALSFSGKDRQVARELALRLKALGVRVFYDEWARADLLGKDLTQHLDLVYRFQARFCIVLLSKNYKESLWTQHELKSVLDRALRERDYLLPIRLDDAEIPGIRSAISYMHLGECSLDEVAGVIAEKIGGEAVASHPFEVPAERVWTSAPRSGRINGFIRQPVIQQVTFAEGDILARARFMTPTEDPRPRWKVAQDLARRLSFFYGIHAGTPYTCWRDDRRFFLSTLPGVVSGRQKTLEFEFAQNDAALVLKAEWDPPADAWGPVPMSTFHSTIEGLIADRSGCSMTRESMVYVLQRLERSFVFPVTPFPDEPEVLCGWIHSDPPNGWDDFDRDPRLVGPQIVCWDTYYHNRTGEGILNFTVQGGWSNNALYAFYDALDFLLPTRHYRKLLIVNNAPYIRVSVHLVNQNETGSETGRASLALDRTYSCIARMCAAEDEVPVPEPSPAAVVPPLSEANIMLFQRAMDSLGDQQIIRDVQDYPADDGTDTWGELHHHLTLTHRINIYGRRPTSFHFGEVVRPGDVLKYIERHEATR